jgi:sulfate adenylyltransferase subunit 1 (EFTu-like GTPase family)
VAPLALNDIGEARLTLNAPLFVDSYDTVRTTGSLILIDEATNHTVAAGLVK